MERAGTLRREGITGFTVRESLARSRVLATKLAKFEAPETTIGAKMNYAYMVALYLVRGEAGPDSITPQALADQRVLTLARAAGFQDQPSEEPAVLVLHYAGSPDVVVQPVVIDRTRPAPFAPELRELKFATLTHSLGPTRQARLRALVDRLPAERSMRRWLREADQAIASKPSPPAACDRPLASRPAKPQIKP
jgi:hypothetical protein